MELLSVNQIKPVGTYRPTIVCLCGSTRFYDAFQKANFEETMKGNIVLSIGFFIQCEKGWHNKNHGETIGVTKEEKIKLDELHKKKIELADEILVLNVGNYIGESTASEIRYAKILGRRIRFLEKVLEDSRFPFL